MSIYLIWFLIGVGFLAFELISPTFILFFFGVGAWITSVSIAIFPNLTFNQQIIIFSISSIALLLLLRNYVKNIFLGYENEGKDAIFPNLSDEESLAVVTKTIQPGRFGEIKFKGTFYKAKCNDTNIEIKVGDSVSVIKQGDEQGSYYLVNK